MRTIFIIAFCIYFSQFLAVNTQSTFCSISYDCSNYTRYSSIDGSCHNLDRPWLGRAQTPLKRMLPPAYNDPIRPLRSKSINGSDLPNPRSVAIAVHFPVKAPGRITLLAVFTGQVLAHDVIFSQGVQLKDDNTRLNCQNQPDASSSLECLNIPIPLEDTLNSDQPYIATARTQPSFINVDCNPTPRDPKNQLTHWLDLSVIYGSDQANSDSLRTKTDGLLLTSKLPGFTRDFLPQLATAGTCVQETATRICFRSGETRANENSVINSVQTLFVREHNRVAGIIKSLRPSFDDEKLFQEARRVLIAEYQHIIYTQWLPLILGPTQMASNGLPPAKSGRNFRRFYDPSINAALYNEFGTAAGRFGHTLVKSSYIKKDVNFVPTETVTLLNITNNPNTAYEGEGLDGICRGAITELANAFDRHFTDTIQNHLFEIFGTTRTTRRSSLSALNINRGRDHGLQPYIEYRRLCGLKADSWDDLTEIPSDVIADLRSAYNDKVEDVDLFSGGVSERPVPGGSVGPTFACIIARQFRDFRFGDRFHYETALDDFELDEIRKVTMARIVCDNLDVTQVPRNPFLPINNPGNPLISCNSIPKMKLKNIFKKDKKDKKDKNDDDDDDDDNDSKFK